MAAAALAQTPTGTILGNVKDASGGAVPGAEVTATHLGTQFSRSTPTDPTGQYQIPLLPVGDYKVEVDAHRLQDLRADGHPDRGRPQRARGRDHRGRAASKR